MELPHKLQVMAVKCAIRYLDEKIVNHLRFAYSFSEEEMKSFIAKIDGFKEDKIILEEWLESNGNNNE